jgi:C_GCAxxG_C_C family probable redox protein
MAFGEGLGLDEATCAKVSCAFGGGISHLGLTCGAVTGALMAIGLRYGGTPEKKEATYEITSEFVEQFTRLHGSTNCTELIGYDLGKPDELAEAREKAIFAIKCVKYVEDAVKILEKLL